MKVKVRFFLVAWALGIGTTLNLHAQVEVTDDLLINPSFETGDATGWLTSPEGLTLGFNGVNTDGDPETKTGDYIYCIYNNPVPEVQLYQTLSVPNGDYMVSCDLMVAKWGNDTRITTQRLFANNTVTYFGKESDYSELNLVAGEEYSFAGCTETTGDASALQTIMIEKVTVTDGTLTIGIRTNDISADGNVYTDRNGSGWFKVDNFRLYRFDGDEGMLTYYRSKLNRLLNQANGLDEYEYPISTWTLLAAARDEAQTVYDETEGSTDEADEERVILAADQLKAALDKAEEAYEVFSRYIGELNKYTELKALDYDGLEELTSAFEKALRLQQDPTAILADFEEAIVDFEAAILQYKISGFGQATTETPVDATFLLVNPDIEQGVEGWTLDGFKSQNTGNNYEGFNNLFLEQWTSSGTLADQSASQTLTGLRNGLYRISAIMIACRQGQPELEIEGAYLYGNNAVKSVMTGDGVGGAFDLITAVTDGTLTLGMKTVGTNANWTAFDNVTLEYCGDTDITAYKDVHSILLDYATSLVEGEMLPFYKNELNEAITNAENADQSTISAIEKSITALNVGIEMGEIAQKGMNNFKSGSYAKAVEIAETGDAHPIMAELLEILVSDQNIILSQDTTTVSVFPVLTADLDKYVSFANKSQECVDYMNNSGNEDLFELIDMVLSSEIDKVAADSSAMKNAEIMFADILSFAKTYNKAIGYVNDDRYSEDALFALINVVTTQLEATQADYSGANRAEQEIIKAIGVLRLTLFEDIVAGEETDVTDLTIVNADVANVIDGAPVGWDLITSEGANSGEHWTGDAANYYLDQWNGTPGGLRYTAKQDIQGIPNGTYKLVAAVRADGKGSYLYATVNDGVKSVEIPNYGNTGGGIWADAPDDSELKAVNGGNGSGWSWVEIEGINVNTNSMTVGCTTINTVAGGSTPWNGYWFSVDDFKLYWTSSDFTIGIEDLFSDSVAELVVYAENGFIVVEGVKEYSIITLNGTIVPANSQLPPGIYIVKAGAKSAKVVVK